MSLQGGYPPAKAGSVEGRLANPDSCQGPSLFFHQGVSIGFNLANRDGGRLATCIPKMWHVRRYNAFCSARSPMNLEHIRQSRPDSGLGFKAQVRKSF